MPRVRIGSARRDRRKKILKRTRGHYGARHRLYRSAMESRQTADQFAFTGRKLKKRDYRALWIVRINGALEEHQFSYSRFMNGLKKANILLNRKALSELAISDPKSFGELVEAAKKALA